LPDFSRSLKASCFSEVLLCDSQPGLYLEGHTVIHQLRSISQIVNTPLNHSVSSLPLSFDFDYTFPWLGDASSQKHFSRHQVLSIPVFVRRHVSIIGDLAPRLGIPRIPADNDVTTFFISSRDYRWGEGTTLPRSKQRDFFSTTSL